MLLFHTHIVLGETGNVARYCLKPVQAVFSRGELYDSAADPVHGYDLESIFPERIKREERRLWGDLAFFAHKLHTLLIDLDRKLTCDM